MNLRSSNGVQDLERDPLTGLYTRASANRIVKIGIEEAQGDEGVISVASSISTGLSTSTKSTASLPETPS